MAGPDGPGTGTAATPVRYRYSVRGVVQGVGFRPFVHAVATALGLSGSVRNTSGGVVVEVEGGRAEVAEFGRRLRAEPPPLASVEEVESAELAPTGATGFAIAASHRDATARTPAAPDTAICADCLREMSDPADRRYRHPFITCTNCGPRFTIITGLPYDRPATTMAGFELCAACAREYADPTDRRFHAQPVSCRDCGPRLEFVAADGGRVVGDDAAVEAARRLLVAGGVLAVKGIGGYHLACVATDERAVTALRERKRRGAKPFAVMVADLATARAVAELDDRETALLTGPARPIVLARRRPDPPLPIADAVAPGNPDLGLLLPYAPVHHLLHGLPGDRPIEALVMTSGNTSGEPLAADDADALHRLAPLVDGWLRHDRPIHVPCDDSVVRVVDGEELVLRRSRGYAPLPLRLPFEVPPTLAVGADLKNTCCLGSGRSAWFSGHIGDMDDVATLTAFGAAERHLEHLTGVAPQRLAADAHPEYRSRAWAVRHAAGRPVRSVQHHHAHLASVLADHGLDGSSPVVGIAFDGTGYGTDGAVWGGEVLVGDYLGFRRFAQLGYVPLPGGDAAVRRPYRMALAHLHAAGIAWDADLPPVAACPDAERGALAHQLGTGLGCAPTSSMGRLFDAVSALLGVRQEVDFEAQAAIELEARAREAGPGTPTGTFAVRESGDRLVADPAPVLRSLIAQRRAGTPVAVSARRFHDAVAVLVVELALRARAELDLDTVALTGGVFQNALLLGTTGRALRAAGFTVLRHRGTPPGDGGLALGQLLVAAATDNGRG
ncbi:carbamoyltransferase HypF [Saccharopolyspora cebuensis]|uniref:Carbamoyltransferase n=1 Tax=Saccharopolyspora cebuensis TaxID=418759 RepID=A0ABV4CLV5_9PSEU